MQGTDVVAAIYLAEYLNVDMSDIMDKLDGFFFMRDMLKRTQQIT